MGPVASGDQTGRAAGVSKRRISRRVDERLGLDIGQSFDIGNNRAFDSVSIDISIDNTREKQRVDAGIDAVIRQAAASGLRV